MRAAGHGVEVQFQFPVPVVDFMQRSYPTDQLFNWQCSPSFNFPTAQDVCDFKWMSTPTGDIWPLLDPNWCYYVRTEGHLSSMFMNPAVNSCLREFDNVLVNMSSGQAGKIAVSLWP
ncbi:hypothetical protein Ancab_023350 [Ancistrocladus abbreviatus]